MHHNGKLAFDIETVDSLTDIYETIGRWKSSRKDEDMFKQDPVFRTAIAGETKPRTYVEPRPKMKTKADMLKRIEYLEGRIDENNRIHAEEMKDLRLHHAGQVRGHLYEANEDLVQVLKDGVKNETFPRRS